MIYLLPELLGGIVRREGRKFLQLESAAASADADISADRERGVTLLYVHIPFCRALCPFCCFNRYLYDEDSVQRYFDDLSRELDLYLQRGFKFSAVYFGGGTPTIEMARLTGFIGHLKSHCAIGEISLETTPGELTSENIALLKEAGINRLSVGVQSFDEKIIKAMGRKSPPPDEIKRRLRMLAGMFDTVNIDFVFNFPEQTLEQFSADVAAFKAMELDQATFYPLMPSPHKMEALERRYGTVDTSREQRFYDILIKALYHDGYTASTPWCFSRSGRMIDEYIVEHDNYIGIGTGSVSMVHSGFHVNCFSLDRYHERVAAGRLPIAGRRRLSQKERLRYHLLAGLFGIALDTEGLRQRLNKDIQRSLRAEFTLLKVSGVIADKGHGMFHVTEKGMYAVSVMMREFFVALNTLREQGIENLW